MFFTLLATLLSTAMATEADFKRVEDIWENQALNLTSSSLGLLPTTLHSELTCETYTKRKNFSNDDYSVDYKTSFENCVFFIDPILNISENDCINRPEYLNINKINTKYAKTLVPANHLSLMRSIERRFVKSKNGKYNYLEESIVRNRKYGTLRTYERRICWIPE